MPKRKYTWRPDVPDIRDHKLKVSRARVGELPKSVNLTSKMPEVWDQGELGSCTAHAIGAAVRYIQKKQHPKLDFMPSRLFIYYNERAAEGTINEDAGAMIRTGIKVVNKLGVPSETLWLYNIAKFKVKPSAKAFTAALTHQALEYQRVPQTQAGIKTALAAGMPVVFGFAVYESFEGEKTAKTGIVALPEVGEQSLGGHAVCAVGYDDKYVIVRNSWGPEWGLKGYFKMPWAYVLDNNLSDDFWAIQTMEA